jgi:hypothetical protein
MQATARVLGTTLGTTTLALSFQVAGAGGGARLRRRRWRCGDGGIALPLGASAITCQRFIGGDAESLTVGEHEAAREDRRGQFSELAGFEGFEVRPTDTRVARDLLERDPSTLTQLAEIGSNGRHDDFDRV